MIRMRGAEAGTGNPRRTLGCRRWIEVRFMGELGHDKLYIA
jgi:hypothetical protein